jgi:hypothetical protein
VHFEHAPCDVVTPDAPNAPGNVATPVIDAVGRARNGVVAVLVGVDADFLVGVDTVGHCR